MDSKTNSGLAQLLNMHQKDITKDTEDENFSWRYFGNNNSKQLLWRTNFQSIGIHWLWALYLPCSSGAYETLRKSGVLLLPSSRMLREYCHLSHISSLDRLWYYCWSYPTSWSSEASKSKTIGKICLQADRWGVCKGVQQIYWIINWFCRPRRELTTA